MKSVFGAIMLPLSVLLSASVSAQMISSLRHEPFNNKIIVNYDVQGLSSQQRMEVNLYCSDDGFKKSLVAVTGNGVGADVSGNGEKTIVWDVLKDRKQLSGDISFTIKALVMEGGQGAPSKSVVAGQTTEDKKTDVYQEFSSTLSEYINEGRNVTLAFSQASDRIFDDPVTVKKITESVKRYNHVYDRLNNNRISYEKQVLQYWGHEAHTAVQSIDDYALGDLHRVNILALNDALLLVNQLGTGQISGRKNEKEARDKVLATIQHNTSELEKRFNELERRYTRTVYTLEHQ